MLRSVTNIPARCWYPSPGVFSGSLSGYSWRADITSSNLKKKTVTNYADANEKTHLLVIVCFFSIIKWAWQFVILVVILLDGHFTSCEKVRHLYRIFNSSPIIHEFYATCMRKMVTSFQKWVWYVDLKFRIYIVHDGLLCCSKFPLGIVMLE